MGRSWPMVVAIGVWAVAMSEGVSAAAEELALQPLLQQPIELVREMETTFFDHAVGGIQVHTVRDDARDELVFTREAGVLQVRTRGLRSSQWVNGKETENIFARAAEHPLVMELDDRGQAQRVVDIAAWVEPIQQSLMQMSGAKQPVNPAPVEAVLLRSWNTIFGVPWAVLAGRPLALGTTVQFKGRLQLGLPQIGPQITAIEEAPVVGSVTVTEDGASGAGTLRVRYTYSSEVVLDDDARTQLVRALGDAATHLTAGRWLSASMTGTTEAVMDRATLMFRVLTIEQELQVKGEAGASFREERTVKVRRPNSI